MKRNGNITSFFKPFAEPSNHRALSEERRDRGPSFPSLSVLDSSKRSRLPSSDHVKDRPASPSAPSRDILSPTPPSEIKPTHASRSSQSLPVASSPPDGEGATSRWVGGAEPSSSFISSCSSLPAPQPSQSSTASKRIVKDGLMIVRTSDSEEDSDSGSDLEDLSTILNKKRRAQAPPGESRPAMKVKEAKATPAKYGLRSYFKPPPPKREFRSIIAPRKEYRINLSDLVAAKQRGLNAEARVLEAQRKAEEAERAENECKESSRLTREGLSTALGDDEDAQRTLDALERTEALETSQVWQFFMANGHQKAARTTPKFPAQSLSKEGWHRILIEPSTRNAVFISGIVKNRVYEEALPDEVMLWMIEELCQNRKEELTSAYLDVLDASAPQLRKLLDKQTISSLFAKLGARKEAITMESEQPAILPAEVSAHDPRISLHNGIRPLLELLRRAAPNIQSEAVQYVLAVLIRLSFDDSVRQDGYTQTQCQEAIAAMLRTPSAQYECGTLQHVSQSLFNNFRNHGPKDDRFINHGLQAQLVQSLPFGTQCEAAFQRRLALAFFLDSPKPLTLALTAPGILPAVLQSLSHNPLYRFGRSTDYADVTAAFTLLDTAVDNGFSNRAFTQTLRSLDRRARDAASRQLRDAARATEDEFNLGIDALTATIRRIMGQIRGSGTDSVRMSEAKGAMERLVYRLESSVRTREKSSKDIFADGVGRSAGLLESWVEAGGGSNGGGGIEEVNGNAPKKEEDGGVKGEPDDERADQVAPEVDQDVKVVDDDVGGDVKQEADGT
ncbi:uncharacterized protein BKCO1_18000131 [Diplodia corticola]|uniref:Uncharacterized protein n=1 Tax=Diplodia corticola TaxID=236234 RepID=A0A1J9R1P2_9PEZI|nr:uncharacterized protein BKCO1_18000131 [Diplodia corticola]OJD35318.1 hypothetical protein BKCO1_18000131 [Diplodia corticola]